MKIIYTFILLIIGLLFFNNSKILLAQEKVHEVIIQSDTIQYYEIKLNDGTELKGTIKKQDSKLAITTQNLGVVLIDIDKIHSIKSLQATDMNSKYWFKNPRDTRYLFSPSAFNLQKGEKYYQNTYIALNSMDFGITNHFSVGVGLEIFSTFVSLSQGQFMPIFYITPKIATQIKPNWGVGAGVIYASIPNFSDERMGLGLAYAVNTLGNREHNLTLGIGFPFIRAEGLEQNLSQRPVFTLSGMTRISHKMALVSENWFLPISEMDRASNYYGFWTYGMRFLGQKISIDLAFINNRDIAQGIFIGIPYLDFAVKF